NTAVVTGPGSVWSNSAYMSVGESGRGNLLIVSNGGAVFNTDGFVGFYAPGALSNSVIVTGTNSLWKNSGALYVGYGSSISPSYWISGNSVIIAAGGSVLAS